MIFLDSSYLIALLFKNDSNKEAAITLKPLLAKEHKIINNTVMVEVLNSLKKTNHEMSMDEIVDYLLKADEIIFLNQEDYYGAVEIFKYYNGSINFSDCTILKTMQDLKINKIVSFDSDFDKVNGIKRIYL